MVSDESVLRADGEVVGGVGPMPGRTVRALDGGRRSGARRERILDAALALFVERTYAGTTMDDVGAAVGLRGPSLYKHVRSKQELLAELMSRAIRSVQEAHDAAIATTDDEVERLRRAVEAHVRFHARHRLDAYLANRELASLEGEARARIMAERKAYERSFLALVQAGVDAGRFDLRSVKLTALALLDQGTGVAVWFRPDGELNVDELAYHHGDMAVRLVGAERPGDG
jgi:AcrR family transcriptional regulator